KEFPKHALYGEEGTVGDQSSEYQWVIDPLDGTVNYFYGIPHFCVSIALRFRNEIMVGVIYDPIRREMWKGQKGETPKLNGDPVHVSDRAGLAEAVVSVGLAKTGETISANFPLLQQMVHRVRKCRVLGSAALAEPFGVASDLRFNASTLQRFNAAKPMIRCGIGYDVHRLAEGRKLILGGVEIAHSRGLEGHSDADVLSHAIADALLGAIG